MVSTFCGYFNRGECRSCQWIEQEYARQLEAKEHQVRERLAFFPPFTLEPSAASPQQGFRNRAKMTVTGTLEHPVLGLTGEQSLDEGRELLQCPIHHPRLNELLTALPPLLTAWGLEPYRIGARTGELKGLIAFYSPGSQQAYLRFILRSKDGLPRIRAGLQALQARFGWLRCVSANIQPVPHAILEGPEEIILSAEAFIDHQLADIRFRLAPQAFVQTNVEVATRLYQAAADWIVEAAPSKMLELYCGQGAFSLFAAQAAERTARPIQCLGIEINPDAISAARASARELGLSHVEFVAADATSVAAKIAAFAPQLGLVNPPRRGLGVVGCEQLLVSAPEHLLYSSCSVESLARDLKMLSPHYPHIRRVRVFDLFPHTEHFETLVWLERAH